MAMGRRSTNSRGSLLGDLEYKSGKLQQLKKNKTEGS